MTSGRALAVVHASGHRRMQSIDMGVHGAHAFVRQTVDVPPGGEAARVSYLAMAKSVEEAKLYAGLGNLQEHG